MSRSNSAPRPNSSPRPLVVAKVASVLEALAFAMPLTMLLLMVLGLLETGMTLDPGNFGYRHVWAFLPLACLVGMTMARRRYAQ